MAAACGNDISNSLHCHKTSWNSKKFKKTKSAYSAAKSLIVRSSIIYLQKQTKLLKIENNELKENSRKNDGKLKQFQNDLNILENIQQLSPDNLETFFEERMQKLQTFVDDHCNQIHTAVQQETEYWDKIYAVINRKLPHRIMSRRLASHKFQQVNRPDESIVTTIDGVEVTPDLDVRMSMQQTRSRLTQLNKEVATSFSSTLSINRKSSNTNEKDDANLNQNENRMPKVLSLDQTFVVDQRLEPLTTESTISCSTFPSNVNVPLNIEKDGIFNNDQSTNIEIEITQKPYSLPIAVQQHQSSSPPKSDDDDGIKILPIQLHYAAADIIPIRINQTFAVADVINERKTLPIEVHGMNNNNNNNNSRPMNETFFVGKTFNLSPALLAINEHQQQQSESSDNMYDCLTNSNKNKSPVLQNNGAVEYSSSIHPNTNNNFQMRTTFVTKKAKGKFKRPLISIYDSPVKREYDDSLTSDSDDQIQKKSISVKQSMSTITITSAYSEERNQKSKPRRQIIKNNKSEISIEKKGNNLQTLSSPKHYNFRTRKQQPEKTQLSSAIESRSKSRSVSPTKTTRNGNRKIDDQTAKKRVKKNNKRSTSSQRNEKLSTPIIRVKTPSTTKKIPRLRSPTQTRSRSSMNQSDTKKTMRLDVKTPLTKKKLVMIRFFSTEDYL
ncbi:unnamed protein product [Didymodactylos carnosus]|uniref:Uncharacterized protein n=1 Tax=Didymodactylos carnosus TaxID=1234261 RepID=A0A813Z3H8_9BILA|nr:unnamed protein product [Didymodactylos carnosus]CAF0893745.1 unnamed protein product [Didymodactylos carnosus]CAF3573147.1 unnamed protein product [Didymodactylos carnosus]CAF3677527.1 unnamed protein product [Didymodactylos carnosus]